MTATFHVGFRATSKTIVGGWGRSLVSAVQSLQRTASILILLYHHFFLTGRLEAPWVLVSRPTLCLAMVDFVSRLHDLSAKNAP